MPAHTFSAGRTLILLLPLAAVLAGCETTGRVVETGGDKTRDLIGKVEPTGTLKEIEARRSAFDELRLRLEELDVEGFNALVASLTASAEKLAQHVDRIPSENLAALERDVSRTVAAVRTQAEAARLDETTSAVRTLTATLADKSSELDVSKINELVAEMIETVDELQSAAHTLETHTAGTLERVDQLLSESVERISALPADELREAVSSFAETTAAAEQAIIPIRQSVSRFPATMAHLDMTLRSLQITFRVATGVLLLVGAYTIVWLFRIRRRTV